MDIGILGMGFVGGTTAKVFGKKHEILPYDKYKQPFNTRACIEALVREAELAFICVPTPMKPSGEIDYSPMDDSLQLMQETAARIGRNPEEILITIRSTAVSGTTDGFAAKYPFRFAFNPEFLREKHALEDMEKTDRVVLGVSDDESKAKLEQAYKALFPNAKYFFVTPKEAEMVKYMANGMLAAQIALANEFYRICQAMGIPYDTIKDIVLEDSRIGRNLTVPGHDGDFGFGGKCFPKDLNALIYAARGAQYRPYLLEEVWRLNEAVRRHRDWEAIPGATSANKDFGRE